MADGNIVISTKIDQSGFNAGRKSLESGLGSLKGSLKSLATAAGFAFSTVSIINFGKTAVKAATDLENAMTGLKSIMDGQGRSFKESQGFIKSYISDGLIPATEAIAAYKNLALRGYDDSQIQSVLIALKDSAAFGRQASYTLGQAVSSATEGLKNENSILVDNAGVTKNVAKMWDEYARSIGTTVNNLTQQQKIQAEVNGILEESKYQTGDAAKVAESYSGLLLKLQFNFNNLKVAVGDALIPIAKAVLPSLNAIIEGLTKIANLAAQVTTALFGKQAKSQKNIADTGTKAAKSQTALAKATTAAAKAARNAAFSFDELNVVQSESISNGGGSVDHEANVIPNAMPSIGGEIGGEIEVSPKIQKAVDKFKEWLEKIKKILKEFAPLLSGVAAAFATAFAFNWIATMVSKVGKLGLVVSVVNALKTALIYASTAAIMTRNPIKVVAIAFESLWKSFKTGMASLPLQKKLTLSLAGIAAIFVTTSKSIKQYILGARSLTSALLKIIPVAIAVGVAMYAMLGPVGLVAAAIALVAGAVVGFNAAQKEIENKKVLDYFSGLKVTSEHLNSIFEPLTARFGKMTEIIDKHKSTVADLNGQYNASSTSLDMVYTKLEEGTTAVPDSVSAIHDGLISLADVLKKTTDEDTTYYYEAWKETMQNAGVLTESEQSEMLGRIVGFGADKKKHISDIENAITQIHDDAKNRNIGKTVAYTAEELAKLRGFQGELDALMAIEKSKEANKAKLEMANLYEDIKSGRLKISNETYQELLATIDAKEKEGVDIARAQQTEMLANAETMWQQAQIIYDNGSSEYKDAEDTWYKQRQIAAEGYNASITEVYTSSGLARDILLAGLKEESDQYGRASREAERYNRELWDIGLRFDKSSAALAGLNEELYNNDKATEAWSKSWQVESKGVRDELNKMVEAMESAQSESAKKFETYGIDTAEGLKRGIKSKLNDVKTAAAEMAKDAMVGYKVAAKIESPSKEMEVYGKLTAEGAKVGIEKNTNPVVRAAENMFNRILDKMDIFCARFRDATNNLLNGMTVAMNGVQLDTGNRIKYTSMPKVQIPRLATGAVIPPNSEFMAVLGDQRHGRNLEAPESLIRQIVREETGDNHSNEILSKILDAINKLDLSVAVNVNDREIARAANSGNKSMGYPVRV